VQDTPDVDDFAKYESRRVAQTEPGQDRFLAINKRGRLVNSRSPVYSPVNELQKLEACAILHDPHLLYAAFCFTSSIGLSDSTITLSDLPVEEISISASALNGNGKWQ
jgi:hypothetical protein